METLFMNTESTKRTESHKFILNMSQILDFSSSNGHVTLQKLSTYYKRKNIRQQCRCSKLIIMAPT